MLLMTEPFGLCSGLFVSLDAFASAECILNDIYLQQHMKRESIYIGALWAALIWHNIVIN